MMHKQYVELQIINNIGLDDDKSKKTTKNKLKITKKN